MTPVFYSGADCKAGTPPQGLLSRIGAWAYAMRIPKTRGAGLPHKGPWGGYSQPPWGLLGLGSHVLFPKLASVSQESSLGRMQELGNGFVEGPESLSWKGASLLWYLAWTPRDLLLSRLQLTFILLEHTATPLSPPLKCWGAAVKSHACLWVNRLGTCTSRLSLCPLLQLGSA